MAIVETGSGGGGGGGGGGGTESLDWKNSVRAATTGPVTLNGLPTVDGVTMGPDERLLVKDQVDQTENGLWTVAPGSWSRTADANSDAFVTSGLTVYVSEGAVNGTKTFNLITTDPITLGATNLVFQDAFAGTPGGGTVTGTGTPPQVAFWETTTGLTGDDNFTYDGTVLRIAGLGNTLLRLITTSGVRGPYLEWNNAAQTGGSIWSAISTGPSDTSGAGNFLIKQNGEHPVAFVLQKNTGYAGFNNTNPQHQIDCVGDEKVSGMMAVGNDGQFGVVSGSQRYVDMGYDIQNFTAATSFRLHSARFILDPDIDYIGVAATGNYTLTQIKADNPQNFGTVLATNSLAQHFGTGTVNTIVGHNIAATTNSTGNVTTLVGANVQSLAAIGSASVVSSAYGMVFVSGSQDAGSAVTDNRPILIRTPRYEGGVTTSTAIYIEDQTGATNSYAIRSFGGVSEHAGFFGFGLTNPTRQVEVANEVQITTSSTVGSYLYLVNSGFGGADWRVKSNGAADLGGAGAFAISSFSDGTTPFFIAPVTNNTGLGTVTPQSRLHVNGSISVKRASVSGNYTITVDDFYIAADTSTAGVHLLPSAAVAGAGKLYIIKDSTGNALINNITVTPVGLDTIDGGSSSVINTNFGFLKLVSDGIGNWEVVG